MFMNEAEIEWMHSRRHACPNVRKGVNLIYRLMQSVNAQSDGWAYWSPPNKACAKLIDLLKTAGNLMHDTSGTITAAQLRAAITPIRTMVTTQTIVQKEHGNTFTFDVDAALAN